MTILILSSLVCPTAGLTYATSPISVADARALVRQAGFTSAVGHAAAAELLSELLGVRVPVQRATVAMGQGDQAVCLKLQGRVEAEGGILDRREMEAQGYSLVLMTASSGIGASAQAERVQSLTMTASVAALAGYGFYRVATLWREHRKLPAVGFVDGVPIPLSVVTIDGKPVEAATAEAFRAMRQAAAANGVRLQVVSGFRTMDEQRTLYRCYLEKNCNNGNLAAKPGYSNHQSGQALDLNSKRAGVLAWLRSHASEFGFFETIESEPWHWEFIQHG